ncbi:hypothetical protein MUK72_05615 [Halococcus dombrowskii]|uniref:DUF8142 domain-containing protein n=1 Tax=Halococcus dombrowskii TaxID=179637 RepID=A0AAV3SHZ7_HALDO|nr:hypothetical protein [Halococcus dombrowskii]UOO96188.1 hypothetical protein MUK72_05615 [Halococcus dombrowskii]
MGNSEDDGKPNRKRAALAVLPFLALGLASVAFVVLWGLKPIMGLAVLPPILFVSALAWVAFRGGFINSRLDDPDDVA